MRNGLLTKVLDVMRIVGSTWDIRDKLCVLMFDEMKVQETMEYDTQADEIVGPYKQLQLTMVRGLSAKWKQPVRVDFDQKITKELLFGLIRELHQIGYPVVCCTSDCGGGNVGLWKELSIGIDEPFFFHPITKEKIFYVPDVPHLLKLLRNWLLDGGFILHDGTVVNAKPLRALLALALKELTVCPKLREQHLSCRGPERQNVRLAANLISRTVGTALLHYKPGGDEKLAVDTGNFILLMNEWFDLMNVYTTKYSKIPSQTAYGMEHLDAQNELLTNVRNVILGMRCYGKSSLQIFQKGIIMGVTALPLLLESVRKYGIKYILTTKLEQDIIENSFSQLRTRGGLNDHPSPLDALYRLRVIILGKNPGLTQRNTNVQGSNALEEEDVLFGSAMKHASIDVFDEIREEEKVDDPDPQPEEQNEETVSGSQELQETIQTEIEDDGLSYLGGWLAFKFATKYPHLGSLAQKHEHDYVVPPWIHHLSYGGLRSPSATFMSSLRKMERLFLRFAGGHNIVPKGRNIVKRIADKILNRLQAGEVEDEVIKRFVKLRVIIRMRYALSLMKKQREEKEAERKKKEETEG